MNIEETVIAINKLSDLITQNIPDIAQTIATQTKSLIQERIQEFGLNSQEAELTAYSTAYKKVRTKKGLQTNHTDLTSTGQMWRGTRITEAGQAGAGYEVTVTGADGFSKNKLNWNSDRYGDVLQPSAKEEAKMVVIVDEALTELIKEAGL